MSSYFSDESTTSLFSYYDQEPYVLGELDSSQERYYDAMRDLQKDRKQFKVEKTELNELQQNRDSFLDMESVSKNLQYQHMLREDEKHEGQLEGYTDQITFFKDLVEQLRKENLNLRGQVGNGPVHSNESMIRDLEGEVRKWETLYQESVDLGASRMSHLEKELDVLRETCQTSQKTANDAKVQLTVLYGKLQESSATAKARRRELKAYKRKSRQRLSMLKDLLDQAQVERGQEMLPHEQHNGEENSLLDQIEYLEGQLNTKEVALQRQYSEAVEREMELRDQLEVARSTAEGGDVEDNGDFEEVCTIFARKMSERFCVFCHHT